MAPLFTWASASGAVTALIGTNPTRFWPFGEAPQKGREGYGLPYAVWQAVYGTPLNYVADLPDADQDGIQVDAYAVNPSEARALAKALRDAFEPHGYVVASNGEGRETATGLFRVGFTAEFLTDR